MALLHSIQEWPLDPIPNILESNQRFAQWDNSGRPTIISINMRVKWLLL